MAIERTEDDEMDLMLERHFADCLDGQFGRAARAFEEHRRPVDRRTWFVRAACCGIAGLAAAAVIAMALVPRDGVPGTVPRPPVAPVAKGPAEDGPGALERVVWSRTTDLGTVLVDGKVPARKIVREQVREVTWTDAAGQRHLRATRPEQDVLLISLDRY
jgi:hypothetical protein